MRLSGNVISSPTGILNGMMKKWILGQPMFRQSQLCRCIKHDIFEAATLVPSSHGSLNVPIEHHPTIRYIVYNGYFFRWCPIFPKWDSYQPLVHHKEFLHNKKRCQRLPRRPWNLMERFFRGVLSSYGKKSLMFWFWLFPVKNDENYLI